MPHLAAWSSVALWIVASGIAALALLMIGHLAARALWRTRAERQREMDGMVLSSLQAGIQADELILRLAKDNPDLARRALIHGLRALGKDFIPFITYVHDQLGFGLRAMRDLRSYSWVRRAEAALELGALRKTEAVTDCLALLRDPHPEVRLAAARALSDIGAPQAVRPLLEAIPQCTRWAISDAVDLVKMLGAAAGPELEATLAQSTVKQARLAAVEAIGEVGHREAYDTVRSFLNDSDIEFRIAATRSIGRLGGRDVFEALGKALKDSAWQVRAAAARALGAYREPEALQLLETALTDAAWWVRLNAAESLSQHSAQGVESLRRTLNSSDAFARDIAAQMLQRLQPGGGTA